MNDIELLNVNIVNSKPQFNLRVNGVTIYGMRVNQKDGQYFICFPRYKSNFNEKYYNHVYVKFSEEEKEAIIDAVMEEVSKKNAVEAGKKVTLSRAMGV